MYKQIIDELKNLSDEKFAKWLMPFLNLTTSSDEKVLGIRAPKLKSLAKIYKNIDEFELQKLLDSKIHEAKMLAVQIMLLQVKKIPQKICNLYLSNLNNINNWDLIDYSAPYIVAPNVSKTKLRELAENNYLWANRVAMVSTIYYIRQNDFNLALEFAKKFINHPHHLMHKASGWMLREIGKRNEKVLQDFLEKYSAIMPAIMRSYAREIFRKSK